MSLHPALRVTWPHRHRASTALRCSDDGGCCPGPEGWSNDKRWRDQVERGWGLPALVPPEPHFVWLAHFCSKSPGDALPCGWRVSPRTSALSCLHLRTCCVAFVADCTWSSCLVVDNRRLSKKWYFEVKVTISCSSCRVGILAGRLRPSHVRKF